MTADERQRQLIIAWDKGYEAAMRGGPCASPYSPDSEAELFESWVDGYVNGEQDRKEEKWAKLGVELGLT